MEIVLEHQVSYSAAYAFLHISLPNLDESKNMLYYKSYRNIYQHPLIVNFKGHNSATFAVIYGKCRNTLPPRPHSTKMINKHCGNRTNTKKDDSGFFMRVERLYLLHH